MASKKRNYRGFSLIEVMVVVVIIGMLAGVAAVAVNSKIQDGRVARATSDLKNFETAILLYEQDYGKKPTKLEKLFEKQKKSPEPYIKGKKGDKLIDPWGKKYKYKLSRGIYTITSYGKNSKKGGQDYEKDIEVSNAAEN